MKDMKNNMKAVNSIDPDDYIASENGVSADLQGFDGAMLVFSVGTVTDGTHTPKMQESDDNATWNDVASSDQEGTLADLASDTNQQVGYLGVKQYIRAVLTVAGATSGAQVAALIVLGKPHLSPVA